MTGKSVHQIAMFTYNIIDSSARCETQTEIKPLSLKNSGQVVIYHFRHVFWHIAFAISSGAQNVHRNVHMCSCYSMHDGSSNQKQMPKRVYQTSHFLWNCVLFCALFCVLYCVFIEIIYAWKCRKMHEFKWKLLQSISKMTVNSNHARTNYLIDFSSVFIDVVDFLPSFHLKRILAWQILAIFVFVLFWQNHAKSFKWSLFWLLTFYLIPLLWLGVDWVTTSSIRRRESAKKRKQTKCKSNNYR